MQSIQTRPCYDHLVLQRLLSEQLADEEENIVLAHIEDCDLCRQTIAGLAGDGQLERDIQHHLADHGVSEPGVETVLESDLVEAEIEQVHSILGPTDDPYMMGRLGAYEVVSMIGRGSTGIVFKALDKGLNRFVAIKMLIPSFAGNGTARERFAREGRSIASVRDQHVVQVFAVSEHKGLPFIVMEYLPTGSLAQRIANDGPLQTIEVVRIGMQIAQALAAAHRQGIVHRDVKPANVLLANGVNRALVTDFGLARLLDEASMTHSGAISGTPQFMSPEQAQGSTVDHRSDLFSLGSVLYAACTGHSPFRSETIFGVIKRVCESEPRPIQEVNAEIDTWMCDFIGKLHAKSPDQRFQSAEEVAEYLAAEVAHAQSPATVPEPPREWQENSTGRSPFKVSFRRWPIAICTMTLGAAGLFGLNLPATQKIEITAGLPTLRTDPGRTTITLHAASVDSPVLETRHLPTFDKRPFEMGRQFLDSRQYSQAIRHFRQAAKEPALAGISLYNIGCCFAYLDDEASAIDALKQAVAAGYHNKQYYMCDKDLDSLRQSASFQALIAELEKQEEIRSMLSDARTLRDCQQYVKSEERYRQVLDALPASDEAAMNLGLVLHLQGKLEEALPWHQRAARSSCYAPYGFYNIACYHSLHGEKDEAFANLRKAIEAGYINIYQFQADQDLEAIRSDARYEDILSLAEQRMPRRIVKYITCESNNG